MSVLGSDQVHERGIEVSHETIRVWWNRFGPMFAAEIRRKRAPTLSAAETLRPAAGHRNG